jgi:selenoprotein W-related protein
VTDVEIEYCVPCGFRDRALDVSRAILNACEDELASLTLMTGAHGIFQVRVDGRMVYDKDETEFDVDAIARRVRAEA